MVDWINAEIKTHCKEECPVSVILFVDNVPVHLQQKLSEALSDVRYGQRPNATLSFYTQDGITYLSRNGQSDRTKNIVLKLFFANFNHKHQTNVTYLTTRQLDYSE